MADQEYDMNGEDFSQDVRANEDDDQMNGAEQQGGAGEGTNHEQNGSAEAPGRDDDRYFSFSKLLFLNKVFFSLLNLNLA